MLFWAWKVSVRFCRRCHVAVHFGVATALPGATIWAIVFMWSDHWIIKGGRWWSMIQWCLLGWMKLMLNDFFDYIYIYIYIYKRYILRLIVWKYSQKITGCIFGSTFYERVGKLQGSGGYTFRWQVYNKMRWEVTLLSDDRKSTLPKGSWI